MPDAWSVHRPDCGAVATPDAVRRASWHGLGQGIGLIVLLFTLYSGAQAWSISEDTLRSMMFTLLVLSSLALIYSNRTWRFGVLSRDTHSNQYFRWITLLTLGMLGIAITVPFIAHLFKFQPLTPMQIVICIVLGLCSLIWLEGLKWLRLR